MHLFSLKKTILSVISCLLIVSFFSGCEDDKSPRVLVFYKTKGYYHESIPAGVDAIKKLGKENNFKVDATTDASTFTEDKLKKYRAVVFLSTTGNILNSDQQVAFQRYIQAGGGFVGIHAAADTEYNWPWYNKLVGAYFLSHPNNPNVRDATVVVSDTSHVAMKNIPAKWNRKDEWYNYKSINRAVNVLAKLDEETYEGGENGDNHPIAWYHEYDGGRAFYTGGGHTAESFSEPLFLQHILGGIQYAMGDGASLDYDKSYAVKAPEDNRFTKVILSDDLNEPMELAVAPDGRVFFVERSGKFFMYDPKSNATKLVRNFPVLQDSKEAIGNGLLGITLDPDFSSNNFIYFFYTPDKTPVKQHVSRFQIIGRDSLNISSEKVIIEIPIELEVSAHTGGSLAWDAKGNLFISTGDNTVPFASDGYAPIDEIPGRITFDAQRSSSNTNDLRGKILRIHVEKDGSYTIPEGNLFPKGTPGTRPEIFAMGCRNPYRISVDPATSVVYWGEIGPDAGDDGEQGPRGYDEINQAKTAGNYGWPYFVGDNKAYHEYDFATKTTHALFDPTAPSNPSVNNTGRKTLPAARKAMIWYPYAMSSEFTDLGTGGRSAMAGPVFHYNKSKAAKNGLPEYYDKALFIFDWMRNWVFAVRLDDSLNYKRVEPFMSLTGGFKRPIDMEIGQDGVMYMLEYGSVYGIDNVDARLVRIDYNAGNRAPVANISAADSVGLAPLKVKFNSTKSFDYDEDDELKYEWAVNGTKLDSKDAQPEHVFTKEGVYAVTLKVTDPSGEAGLDTMKIMVGNTLPQIAIQTSGNSSFMFDNTPFRYSVKINDKEDKTIDSQRIAVTMNFIPKEAGFVMSAGHQQPGFAPQSGKVLMDGSDCKACHQLDGKSVGPAFVEVSNRYKDDKEAVSRLARKIITGGGGIWGEHAMNAHPQLTQADAEKIVKYILSLSKQKSFGTLPVSGEIKIDDKALTNERGNYVLEASYTDRGGAITPLTNTELLVLRSPRVEAEDVDIVRNMNRGNDQLGSIHNRSYFVLKNIDLKGIRQLTYRYSSKDIGATIEVRVGSTKGKIISTLNYDATGAWSNYREASAPITDPGATNDLYFVFKKESEPNQHMFSLDWVEFRR